MGEFIINRSVANFRALCGAFLQVKQTNKINLELKEKSGGLRSIKKVRACIFTHLFEQIEETGKIRQHGAKVSLFNYFIKSSNLL